MKTLKSNPIAQITYLRSELLIADIQIRTVHALLNFLYNGNNSITHLQINRTQINYGITIPNKKKREKWKKLKVNENRKKLIQ